MPILIQHELTDAIIEAIKGLPQEEAPEYPLFERLPFKEGTTLVDPGHFPRYRTQHTLKDGKILQVTATIENPGSLMNQLKLTLLPNNNDGVRIDTETYDLGALDVYEERLQVPVGPNPSKPGEQLSVLAGVTYNMFDGREDLWRIEHRQPNTKRLPEAAEMQRGYTRSGLNPGAFDHHDLLTDTWRSGSLDQRTVQRVKAAYTDLLSQATEALRGERTLIEVSLVTERHTLERLTRPNHYL